MDEMEFRNRLVEALEEPAVPTALVENTVARVKTVERGMAAERRLKGGYAPPGEQVSLLADSIIGRLARSGTLPLGADTRALKQQLLRSDRFQKLSGQDPKVILTGWDNGKLSGDMLHQPPPAKTATKPRGPSLGAK